MKKVLVPLREQGQKVQFLRYHLVCRGFRPLIPVPTHRLPCNAGNASKDTQGHPFSPCPRRPICCPAFRSALSYAKLSVDALAVLLPPQWFMLSFLLLNYISVRLSRTIFRLLRNWLPLSWRCDKIIKKFQFIVPYEATLFSCFGKKRAKRSRVKGRYGQIAPPLQSPAASPSSIQKCSDF